MRLVIALDEEKRACGDNAHMTDINETCEGTQTHLKTLGSRLIRALAALFTCSTSGSSPCTHCQNTSSVKSLLTTTAGTSQPVWRILLWVKKAFPCTGLPASQLALALKLDGSEISVVLLYMAGGFRASKGSRGVLGSLLGAACWRPSWLDCGAVGQFAGPGVELV